MQNEVMGPFHTQFPCKTAILCARQSPTTCQFNHSRTPYTKPTTCPLPHPLT